MSNQARKLSPRLEARLIAALTSVSESGDLSVDELAQAVKSLSDYYVNFPGRETPWAKDFAVPATLAYFMPLNAIRLSETFREVRRFVPAEAIREIWDFGSGLGTTQWVLEDQEWLDPVPLYSVESGREARAEHQRIERLIAGRWRNHVADLSKLSERPGRLAVFSYSFLEMQNALPDLTFFDHVLILEPSTRECGRALMEWRSKFIAKGLQPLAPCTHSMDCPLLVHSPRDWCHMRVHFEGPEWWQAIEDRLPMKNRTLTYSYLLMSRTVEDREWRGRVRVIGDTLEEKGKTRQMICRGSDREFFAWMHKNGEAPMIPHGSLVRDLGLHEVKSNELRVSRDLRWED